MIPPEDSHLGSVTLYRIIHLLSSRTPRSHQKHPDRKIFSILNRTLASWWRCCGLEMVNGKHALSKKWASEERQGVKTGVKSWFLCGNKGDWKGLVSPTGLEDFCKGLTGSWSIPFKGVVNAAWPAFYDHSITKTKGARNIPLQSISSMSAPHLPPRGRGPPDRETRPPQRERRAESRRHPQRKRIRLRTIAVVIDLHHAPPRPATSAGSSPQGHEHSESLCHGSVAQIPPDLLLMS